MKRGNEFLVGATILAAIAVVVAGVLWLSQTPLGRTERTAVVRFRQVGGLKVGAPVTLRGVRVGRIEAMRIAGDWVEAEFQLRPGVEPPANPAVIGASAGLFGDWNAEIVPLDQPMSDVSITAELQEVKRQVGDAWPGVTLPDVGQLTAQANRIANDVASLTSQVRGTFDSVRIQRLRTSVEELQAIIRRIDEFSQQQTAVVGRATRNVAASTEDLTDISARLRTTLGRVDSATANGELQEVMQSAKASAADIRQITGDLREVTALARERRASLVRVVETADSLLTRIERGNGTLGLLASDSTLYREATATVVELRALLADIRANPRKYFKFSVF